ncbi:hypothetical protein WJX75_007237 [Coccomyxa subellipsoidea]|uniref:Protein kinase domain-containing protein n=1 Tax=Coccomyxa subellipsoidea TaxID=248742 RepID=A0ABR2YD62_9CHLO
MRNKGEAEIAGARSGLSDTAGLWKGRGLAGQTYGWMRSVQQSDRRDGPSERDRPAYSSGRRDDRYEKLRSPPRGPPSSRAPPHPPRRERDGRDAGARSDAQEPRRPASARGDGERPGPPGPPARRGGVAGASPSVLGGASGLFGDLRRVAQERLAAEEKAKKAAERLMSPPEDGEEREEGEAEPDEAVGKKRHSAIVWRTPPKKARVDGAEEGTRSRPPSASRTPPKRPVPMTAAERAAAELEEFSRQSHAGVDPHAPPAVKLSPSVSGEDHGMVDAEAGEGASEEPKRPAMSSRWLDADLEEDPNAGEVGKAAADDKAAAEEEALPPDADEAAGASPVGDTEAGPPARHISMLATCRSVNEYEKLNRISEGTYGVVYRAREKNTGRICALKKVRMEKEKDGFPLTSIREINILLSFHHPNIVDVSEVVVGNKLDDIFMVMEYMEHDLKALQESMIKPFTVSEVKCLMQQLFAGMDYLHENWVLHRDLKTSNILYSNRGELKVCDFGLARQFGSPLRPYTHNVVTLWYRAPELLLGTQEYSTPIDMWSLGCIMAELLTKKVLFDGQSEIEQIKKIFEVLGTPTEENWPGHKKLKNMDKFNFMSQPRNRLRERFPPLTHDGRNALSAEGYALLSGLLQLDPSRRLTAEEALSHRWFSEQPLPKERTLMPTYPDKEGGLAARKSRPQRLQPSPDPRIAGPGLAARAAQVGSLFSKPT